MTNPSEKTQKFFRVLRTGPAIRLIWQSSPVVSFVNMSILLVCGVLPLLSIYLIKLIIDAIINGDDFPQILLLIVAAGSATLLSSLLRSVGLYAREVLVQAVNFRVQNQLHDKSLEIDLAYYENPGYFDTLHRAQQEAPMRPALIVDNLSNILRSSISLLSIAGLIVFFMPWFVILTILAFTFPVIAVRVLYANRIFAWHRRRTTVERRILYFNWILTGKPHAKELRVFKLGEFFKSRSKHWRMNLRQEKLKIASKRTLVETITQVGQTLAIFGSFAFIAYKAIQGSISVGEVVMYYQAVQRGQGFLQEVLTELSSLYENNLFLSYLFEFLDMRPVVTDPEKPKPFPKRMREGMVIDGMVFQYPGSSKEVLKNISISARPGEMIALVGENGAGKTTLMKLLCRFYDPIDGRITVDGIDIRNMALDDLHRRISVLFQDYGQYYLSISDNIRLGEIDGSLNPEGVTEAAASATAGEFIDAYEGGYETVLGKWLEDGEELSAGQWKKIALARMFYRDAGIVILDEPTTSIDPVSESRIIDNIRRMKNNRIIILISHKLSAIEAADRIYLLKDGKVIEEGHHTQLIARQGAYAEMYDKQSKQRQGFR